MNKLITYGVLGYLAYMFFGKAKTLAAAYQEIKVKITGISNIKINLKQLTFNLTLQLQNPTTTPINTDTSGVIKLLKVHVYSDNGTYLGTAIPNNTIIDIPSNGFQIIQDIPAFVNTSNILTIANQLNNINKLTTKLEVEILGQIITV